MIAKIVYVSIILGIFSAVPGKGSNLIYKIDVVKDTIYIGEPIIVKCKLINEGSREVEILAYCGEDLLTYDYSAFYLHNPNNNKEYKYGVFEHADLFASPRRFLLAPKDSIYFYTILCWDGNNGFTYLKYDNPDPGFYKIRSTYLKLESNVDSFYADTILTEEKEIFEQVVPIIDEFWGWPYGTERETTKKILETFPSVIKKEKSILAPFCHYMLWWKSFDDEPQVESLADEFFKKYPNSPLSEKLAFDLYRYYAWHKKDIEKGKTIVLEALKKYPDNLQGYRYLGLKDKKEKPK